MSGADPRADLAGLRAAIDRIDRALVRLLARRQRRVARIAAFKAGPASVRDEARIAQVLAGVERSALAFGLEPVTAAAVWRVLLECSAEEEARLLSRRLDEGQGGCRPASIPPGGHGSMEGAAASTG